MNTREQLNSYLRALEKRLRWLAISKGIAVAAGVALGATVALVIIANSQAFSDNSMLWARVVLFLALGLALGYALVIPLTRLNRKRAATRAESVFPQFQERLLTYVERSDPANPDPMLELLADDTQSVAKQTVPENVAPGKSIFAFAAGAGAAGAVLIWLIIAGPGFLGYGAGLLWAGAPKSGVSNAFYEIQVQPGNKLVRRKDDVPIEATLIGFQAQRVRLMARYQTSSKWEEAVMLPRDGGSNYEFRFAALPEPVEYYVEAGAVKSKTFKLDVTDLPSITHIKTIYHFPSWLHLPDQTEDPSGDLRAVAGTVAEVTVQTDRPLKSGVIELEDGTQIPLQPANEGQGNAGWMSAKVPMQKSGLYHFAALDQGQSVRLSPLDYFIEAQDDQAPSVRINHPGADSKVLPIEEVSIDVSAQDDFALEGMDLHYSVNGQPEKVVPMLANKGVKSSDGHTTLSLEDFKLQPGDVVSMYATAKDARNTSQTDIFFIEAQAYERNYTQSQQAGGGGGGGGGGNQQTQEIWDRQKQVITATYNATRPNDKTKTSENAQYLSDTEKTLKAQAESLSQRMKSRELDASVAAEFQTIIDELNAAGNDMATASDKLKGQQWKDSLPPEQSALKHLDHVQAAQRDIQVAFQRGGGGGGGGGGNAGRDLANLFDLELDTEKNQYEQQQSSSTAEDKQKAIDDAMAKLDELAKRQQELAQQQRTPQTAAQQRYQQDQLMKQAEQLRQQLQQMQQQNGGQQGSQSQQNGQASSQGGSQGGQQSSQSGQQQNGQQQNGQQQQRASAQQLGQQNNRMNGANAQQLQRALDQIKQAEDAMRAAQQAAAQGQQGDSAAQANARRAAQAIGDANQMLKGLQQQDAAGRVGQLADRAGQLAQEQHAMEDRVKQEFGDINSRDPQLRDKANKAMAAQQDPRNTAARQAADGLAKDEEKLAGEIGALQNDIRQTEKDIRTAQPSAASHLRDGASETQQIEAQRRVEQMAGYIRNSYGPMMTSSEAPITQALDRLRDQMQQAQQSIQNGQQAGAARDQQERGLAQLEQLGAQLQNLVQQGQMQRGNQNGNQPGNNQKGGQQPGGQQPGSQSGNGQQPGGQQPGGQNGGGQQPGNGQNAGNQGGNNRSGPGGNNFGGANNRGPMGAYAGPNGGGGFIDPRLGADRQYPIGYYDAPENRNVNPSAIGREADRALNDLRQVLKDDPNALRALNDLQKDLEQVRFGETASPELGERIGRVVLPEWESFEVQLRRKLEEDGSGQAKATSPDKVPAGYDSNVQEYTRRLSNGK